MASKGDDDKPPASWVGLAVGTKLERRVPNAIPSRMSIRARGVKMAQSSLSSLSVAKP